MMGTKGWRLGGGNGNMVVHSMSAKITHMEDGDCSRASKLQSGYLNFRDS